MNEMVDGTRDPARHEERRVGGTVESRIQRLQADVEARKRPHHEDPAAFRTIGLVLIAVLLAFELGARSTDPSGSWTTRVRLQDRVFALGTDIEGLRGQIDFQKMQLERLRHAHEYSSKYRIGADLALAIYEIALAEEINPQLAFALVRVESEFNPRAVSPVGALGYTQLMPQTARLLVPGITRAQIMERDTNLRLGFRFLRELIVHYNGDIRLALLAYNRGSGTVDQLLRAGADPGNGYDELVLGNRIPH